MLYLYDCYALFSLIYFWFVIWVVWFSGYLLVWRNFDLVVYFDFAGSFGVFDLLLVVVDFLFAGVVDWLFLFWFWIACDFGL